MTNDILTVAEASNYLKIKPKTLYKWMSEGRLRCLRFGRCVRFQKSDLDAFIEKSIVEPVGK